MATPELSNAALVLVGHGSTRNAESAAPVYQHADTLRRRGLFAQVRECFWKVEPFIAGVMREVAAPRVFVVPLFISEGYFTQEAIPRELGLLTGDPPRLTRVRRSGAQTLYYCAPVGTHERMTSVLLARARTVVEEHPFPRAPKPSETTLFIAGHGTGQNENSRVAVERQAALIRAQGTYADCQPVFIEEDPRVGDCYQMARTKNIVIVPFFISDGLHAHEDIPVLLGEPERLVRERLQSNQPTWRNPTERRGKRVWYAPAAGTEPGLAEVILDRVREMGAI